MIFLVLFRKNFGTLFKKTVCSIICLQMLLPMVRAWGKVATRDEDFIMHHV